MAEEASLRGLDAWTKRREADRAQKKAAKSSTSTSSNTSNSDPPAASESSPQAAASYREQGNEAFKRGGFLEAADWYAKSIRSFPTPEAYSNRALSFLKLNDYAKAQADCDSALLLNPDFVKAYARRATARSRLGNHAGALEDYARAEALEPTNRLLRAEREREEAILLAVRATTGGDERQPVEVRAPPHAAAPAAAPAPAAPAPQRRTAPRVDTLISKALEDPVTLRALEFVSKHQQLPDQPARTAATFRRTWRDLSEGLRLVFLTDVMLSSDGGDAYRSCFESSFEPDLCLEIFQTLSGPAASAVPYPARLEVVQRLANLTSFNSVTKMFLSDDVKAQLRANWVECSASFH